MQKRGSLFSILVGSVDINVFYRGPRGERCERRRDHAGRMTCDTRRPECRYAIYDVN
jgi:hypothetical protein